MEFLTSCDESITARFIQRPLEFVSNAAGNERYCGIRTEADSIVVFGFVARGVARVITGVVAGIVAGDTGVAVEGKHGKEVVDVLLFFALFGCAVRTCDLFEF